MSDAVVKSESVAAATATAAVAPEVPGPRKVYPYRWLVLALMCLLSALSAFIWLALAPVSGVVMDTYGVDTYQVNLLPVSYEAVYLPFSILSVWWMERYGMRSSLSVAALALLVCAWMRYGGAVLGQSEGGKTGGWGLIMAGTWIAAAGQPFVLNVAARLSIDWFPTHEVALATVIGTMSNGVGQLLGSLLPPYAVITGDDIPKFSRDQAIFTTILSVLVVAFVRDRAPTPPSNEAEIQWRERDAIMAANPDALSRVALTTMWTDAKAMWANKDFRWLSVSFPLAVGAIWALLTVQWAVITPCGYDAVTSGTAGAVAIGVGIITAFLITPVMSKMKAFVGLQRGFTLAGLAAGLFVFGVNQPGSSATVIVAWAFLGGAVQPLLPISLEHAAEQTFPIPPDSSTSVLFSLCNVYALIITYVMTALLNYDVSMTCSSVVTPAAGFYIAVLIIAVLATIPLKAAYKRSTIMEERSALADKENKEVDSLETGRSDASVEAMPTSPIREGVTAAAGHDVEAFKTQQETHTE